MYRLIQSDDCFKLFDHADSYSSCTPADRTNSALTRLTIANASEAIRS